MHELLVLDWFGLVWFYGTSTIVGYLSQIHFYINKQFDFKQFSLAYKKFYFEQFNLS